MQQYQLLIIFLVLVGTFYFIAKNEDIDVTHNIENMSIFPLFWKGFYLGRKRKRINQYNNYLDGTNGPYIFKPCKGDCESRTPRYQGTHDLYPCLTCNNCGICRRRDGSLECMKGNIWGPTKPGVNPYDCACWYYGKHKECWPYSTGQIYGYYDNYDKAWTTVEKEKERQRKMGNYSWGMIRNPLANRIRYSGST